MDSISSQLELFNEIIDEDVANAVIYTRKKIRECERDIYKIEKKILLNKQRIFYDVAFNNDGTINLTVERVRRKLIKVDKLLEEALHHLHKAYIQYKNDLESLYEFINLNAFLHSRS
tara:strand:- start:40 stop:390 length:351 start_codon:yes stop_codon:yes gene_type:complete